jgi:hypothetical protein
MCRPCDVIDGFAIHPLGIKLNSRRDTLCRLISGRSSPPQPCGSGSPTDTRLGVTSHYDQVSSQ